MAPPPTPSVALANEVLPPPLLRALEHVFAQGLRDTMLVGGTALAGFYAGHRSSDDLDLFTATSEAHRATVLACKSLTGLGAHLEATQSTPQYYDAMCVLDGHRFSIDVVLEPALFTVGQAIAAGPMSVADLPTLLMTKAAALISRCGEKDLYDLLWLSEHVPNVNVAELIEAGRAIDQGLDGESLLIALTSATLHEDACGFAQHQGQSPEDVYAKITLFVARLTEALVAHLEHLPAPPLAQLVRAISRWRS